MISAPSLCPARSLRRTWTGFSRMEFHTLTIGQLLERVRAQLPLPERTAVITVDDGFADFATNAWPELQERGMNATLYVTAGVIGGRSSWLAPLQADQHGDARPSPTCSILLRRVVRSALTA